MLGLNCHHYCMNYSLLDRFRGAWWGAVVGQQISDLGFAESLRDLRSLPFHDRNQQSRQTNKNPTFFTDSISKSWLEWSIAEISSMSQAQKLSDFWQRSNVELKASTIALWLLPIILYHHDNWFSLSNFLARTKKQQFSEQSDLILVWCYTIRLALRGELQPEGLTHRVMLGTQLKQKASVEWLKKVEVSCLRGFDSNRLIAELLPMKDREIPLALFCFLNNPQDFSLATQQALSLERQAVNVTALSATLSGAYNGITGIAIAHREDRHGFYRPMMNKTEELIKEWWGIDFAKDFKTVPSVITAPKVLQSRSGLRIISQQEYV